MEMYTVGMVAVIVTSFLSNGIGLYIGLTLRRKIHYFIPAILMSTVILMVAIVDSSTILLHCLGVCWVTLLVIAVPNRCILSYSTHQTGKQYQIRRNHMSIKTLLTQMMLLASVIALSKKISPMEDAIIPALLAIPPVSCIIIKSRTNRIGIAVLSIIAISSLVGYIFAVLHAKNSIPEVDLLVMSLVIVVLLGISWMLLIHKAVSILKRVGVT